MMRPKHLVLAALALAIVQIGFLSWIILARAAVLRDGREILLKVEPVDPRDLLRGDYVRLGYEISRIPVGMVADMPADGTVAAGDIHVRLRRQADGYWQAASARLGGAAEQPAGAEEVELRGRVAPAWNLGPDATLSVDYGMERFYLPEGEGRPIERDMNVRSFGIVAAVGNDGTPQIKALMDGETKLFEEPLY
jgi:uncharacterized membrane-anchored protein